jgi:hypothetical protein
MQKYIRTYYDNKNVIVKLSGCNQCPLLYYDIKENKCKCKYYSQHGSNILLEDINIVYYENLDKVYTHIEFPNWCKLSDTLGDLHDKNKYTFKINDSGIIINTYDTDGINLYIINPNIINPNITQGITIDMTKYVYKNTEINNLPVISNIINSSNNYNHLQETKKTYGECSMCGEEDESVNRNTKFGMCDVCWGKFELDDDKNHFAFINNFRLKRKAKYSKEKFKKLGYNEK